MSDYADLWDKWNTDKEDGKGHCTFGSGQNQMTMTYISFTGWLRCTEQVPLLIVFQRIWGVGMIVANISPIGMLVGLALV